MAGSKKTPNRKKRFNPGSETYLLDQAIEQARKKKADLYNQHPELLLGEIQEIVDEYPEILEDSRSANFAAFIAGALTERYGIFIATANKAASIWNGQ